MVHIAIVDDEIESVEKITRFIRYYHEEKGDPETEYNICKFYDGRDLLKNFSKSIDIIFLDIEMQYVDGISAAEKIRKINSDVVIIFITKLAQMAIKGYEVNALDFIVKPVEYYPFELRYVKALNYLKKNQKYKVAISPIGQGIRYVLSSDIYYVEVQGRHVTFHTKSGNYTVSSHLKNIEKNLDTEFFHYCNRYCIVNVKYVTSIEEGMLTVAGDHVSVSRGKRDNILTAMARYISNSGRI